MRRVLACVDCNSFHVSCGLVFDARRAQSPVVVLSQRRSPRCTTNRDELLLTRSCRG